MVKKTAQKQVKHDCRTCRNGGRENNFYLLLFRPESRTGDRDKDL